MKIKSKNAEEGKRNKKGERSKKLKKKEDEGKRAGKRN